MQKSADSACTQQHSTSCTVLPVRHKVTHQRSPAVLYQIRSTKLKRRASGRCFSRTAHQPLKSVNPHLDVDGGPELVVEERRRLAILQGGHDELQEQHARHRGGALRAVDDGGAQDDVISPPFLCAGEQGSRCCTQFGCARQPAAAVPMQSRNGMHHCTGARWHGAYARLMFCV